MNLKLLSYNIRHGGVGREKQIAAVIRETGADVIVLQEATHPDVVERVAGELGISTWAAKRGFSLGFISRLDIVQHRWHELPELRRAFLEIRPAGVDLSIFGVHLSAVHSNWTERRRIRELNALLKAIDHQNHGPHLLTGDFNTLAPGELLDHRRLPLKLRLAAWWTGGRVDYKTIQIMIDAGYSDGYRKLHSDSGYTFPTWDPHVRLDFVFLPAALANDLRSCQVVTQAEFSAYASDHFPLLSQVQVRDA